MRDKKTTLVLFSFLILLSAGVCGTYYPIGTEDGDFVLGTGFFNGDLDLDDLVDPTATRTITGSRAPLVADLDGDSVNEIIALDGDTLRLYHGKDLDVVTAISMYGNGPWSNFEIYDIDYDGYKEIIYADDDTNIVTIIEYNGTNIFEQTNWSYASFPNSDDGETLIKCGDGGDCILIYFNDEVSGPQAFASAVSFDVNGNISYTNVATGAVDQVFCFPQIRTMQFIDLDQDGEKDFVFGYGLAKEVGAEVYYWSVLEINASGDFVKADTYTHAGYDWIVDSSIACHAEEHVGRYYTNALVMDIDGALDNGLEVVFGNAYLQDDFKMYSYEADGTFEDDYPEILRADGIIISNVFKANAFTDTGRDDFCVLGFDEPGNQVDLLCASELTGQVPESQEFDYDTTENFNLTYVYGSHNILTHSAQHSSATTSGVNLDEIISSYGVFAIDYGFFGDNLELIFESPVHNGSMIGADVQNVGRDDLLVVTPTNIWYIDDGYTKVGAEIDAYTINPCIDSTWGINGTSEITITVTDYDGDKVGARAILYYGDSNEQDSGWTVNSSSGATFVFTFQVNKTIGTSAIRLMARDDDMPLVIDTIDLSFSVADTGVMLGDCVTSVDVTTTSEGAAEEEGEDGSGVNDSFTNLINTTKDNTGANFSNAVWWLLFMAAIAGALFWGSKELKLDGPSLIGVIAIIEIVMLVIGLKLNYFGAGTLIIVLVLAIALISFKWNPWGSGAK